jgi:3-keto-5-aminohexanoate cleavage enzyme
MTRESGLIVNLAPTGNLPMKRDNPHVPITAAEIAADVAACCEAGLSSVHLHARDADGTPTHRKEAYAEIISMIREQVPDLVICVTCSGRISPEFSKRSEVLDLVGDVKPDMASLTLGSMNFMRDASMNTPGMIRDLARKMRDNGIKPELEVFDVGMVNYAKFLIERGELSPPYYFNILLGNVASAQADLLHLATILAALPPNSYWSLAGFGHHQLSMNAVAIAMGGGIRIGLEDNLWMDAARTRPAANADLVKRALSIAALHGRSLLSPNELRQALHLQA